MNSRILLLTFIVSAASSACGGTAIDVSGTLGDSDGGGASVTLTMPLGVYSGCTLTTMATGSDFGALSGGSGAVTLSTEAGALFATLALSEDGEPSKVAARGKVALVPIGARTAAFATGQSFDLQYTYFTSDGDPSPIATAGRVTASAGALAVVGKTLFISATGDLDTGADEFSAVVSCPVPTSLAVSRIVAAAALATPLSTRGYGACTAAFRNADFSGDGSSNAAVKVTDVDGSLTVSASDVGGIRGCDSLEFTISPDGIATLRAGQTCLVQQPCGPPPSLGGPSAAIPGPTPLSNMAGTMTAVGGSLFIDLVGNLTGTCGGERDISLVCPSGR